MNLSVKRSPLTSVNIDAYTPGTAVLVGSAALSIADFLLDYRRLLLDEVLPLLEAKRILNLFFHLKM